MLNAGLAQKICQSSRPSTLQSVRFVRARWERAYLKDLYHRRVLLGADPVISRSAYPNWNYNAELSALSHRIGAPDADREELVRAMTSPTYSSRADVEGGVDEPFLSQGNGDMAERGLSRLFHTVAGQLRHCFPRAPEEMIQQLTSFLTSEEMRAEVAAHLGIDNLVRTSEVPPSTPTTADSLAALCWVLDEAGTRALSADFFLPQLCSIDFADAFPLNDPLAVLKQIHSKTGATELEPRLVRSAGVSSAQPLYVVAIYRDCCEVVGESAGESLSVAVEMAARAGLLKAWGITAHRLLLVGQEAAAAPPEAYTKENTALATLCDKGTDLSLNWNFEPEGEPINMIESAQRYKDEVEAEVGYSYTKRLRHKFSRGTLARRSFRYLVKPKVYTIA